ncbi:MAG: enoyl-CoA hydratase/isomerase family protein [Chloroflexi bacterium]|nr:enoyl-CoA hydratase/isomerase family protein [Chloroflexota bacterium]
MSWQYVVYEQDGPVTVIRMNRPERLNSCSRAMMQELAEAWQRFRDDDSARVAVLTGNGRAFCVGLDIKEAAEDRLTNIPPDTRALDNPYDKRTLLKPAIAAVNGYAFGGGLTMAMRADLRIATESAEIGMLEIERGIFAGWDWQITFGLTASEAAEVAYGFRLSAGRAYEMGLVNKVVPDERLMEETLAWARRIAALPPLALRTTKELLAMVRPRVPDEAYSYSEKRIRKLEVSEDALEAARAWLEKRPPVYKGR